MAKVLVFNVKENKLYEAEVNNFEDYYVHLQADIFDIASRRIGSKRYDIYVDDIGAFRDEVIVSAVNKAFEPMLVGNLIFANHDGRGNTTSLSEEDFYNILEHTVTVIEGDKIHRVVMVEY